MAAQLQRQVLAGGERGQAGETSEDLVELKDAKGVLIHWVDCSGGRGTPASVPAVEPGSASLYSRSWASASSEMSTWTRSSNSSLT